MARKRRPKIPTVTLSFPNVSALKTQLTHLQKLAKRPTAAGDKTLGVPRAIVIVTHCAGSDDLFLTLAELGIDRKVFQRCVHSGVEKAGYTIPINKIPAAPSIRLIDVVRAISQARTKDAP